MDIIITAPQGGGKTHTAINIIMGHLGVKSVSEAVQRTCLIGASCALDQTPRELAHMMRAVKPEAILFDGSIRSPAAMLIAVEAVKIFRETTGRSKVLAVYTNSGTDVVLTDGGARLSPTDHAKLLLGDWLPASPLNARPGNQFKNGTEPRTLLQLQELCAEVGATASGCDFIEEALRNMKAVSIKDLNTDQCITLREQLLTLLH